MGRTFSTLPLHLRGALEAEARRQARRDRKRARKGSTTTTTTDQAPPSAGDDNNAIRGAEPRTTGEDNG
jgi:hypothetical protein